MAGIYRASLLILQTIVGVATGISLIHFVMIMLVRGKGGALRPEAPRQHLHNIFLVPALNEELVIAASVKRLLATPGDAFVLVIDDGSTDRTAGIVQALAAGDDRIEVLQRVAPNARQGKGEARNHAYRKIVQDCLAEGVDLDSIVLCVMDADGLLDTHVLADVDGLFARETVGAVQIGVRIRNRQSVLGRLQDVEFFTYVRLVQQGRNHLGSTGLGGNGQFTRLSALISLGNAPWTKCPTEDLDLGLQLVLKGWRLAFTDKAYVYQERLIDVGKLVRQRTRWVQGYFRCWGRMPDIIVMNGSWYTVVDLLYALFWPAVSCLVLPVATVLSWLVVGWNLTTLDMPVDTWLAVMALGYVLAFGPSALIGLRYRARSGDISLLQTAVLIHSIGLFQFVWGLAGWRAIWRLVNGQGGWAKTERMVPTAGTPT